MENTPRSNRLHIAIFGKRNVGKSTLINALTNQEIALVSNVAGTTTDPVYKSMEILPIGPVVLIDTAGIDDEGNLGKLRIKKTYEVLNKTELAIIVISSKELITSFDENLIKEIKEKNIPLLCVINKIDLFKIDEKIINKLRDKYNINFSMVSAIEKKGIDILKKDIIACAHIQKDEKKIVGDLINPHDIVVLVTPIDKAAPKGRLILPQQQTTRDIIDHGGIVVITRETELKETLKSLGKKPKLVITDSQAFKEVDKHTPRDILLTSFSILFARYKANLDALISGIVHIKELEEGDKVLICEGCTHHRQDGDIARDKIPKWLEEMVKGKLNFQYTSGTSYPAKEDLKKYKLIVHCGGCMLNPKEMDFRVRQAQSINVPIVNYGILIAEYTGILNRAIEIFQ